MAELDKIQLIATDVRYWAEKRARNERLHGWCAIASAELHRRLEAEGIRAELHVWTCPNDLETSHVYLCVDDYIVDVTATQFVELGSYPVFMMHHREAEQYRFYRTIAVYNTPAELIAYQKKSGWPRSQVAYSKSACIVPVAAA